MLLHQGVGWSCRLFAASPVLGSIRLVKILMQASGISLVDANIWLALAAFAMDLGLEVITFDADFKGFSGLSLRLFVE